MNVIELVAKIEEERKKADVQLPRYIDVQDIDESRVCINGKWTTDISVWGICRKDGKWIYFETDNERGYISGIEKYETEEEACEDTYEYLIDAIRAEQDGYSDRDMSIRYMMNRNGYTEEKAVRTTDIVIEQEDIFEEMFNYMRISRYGMNGKETIQVLGYTAENLVKEKGFSPIAAYRFLAELRKKPDEMKERLNAGMVEME